MPRNAVCAKPNAKWRHPDTVSQLTLTTPFIFHCNIEPLLENQRTSTLYGDSLGFIKKQKFPFVLRHKVLNGSSLSAFLVFETSQTRRILLKLLILQLSRVCKPGHEERSKKAYISGFLIAVKDP